MRYPNPSFLLCIGMGDAYAAPTEYLKFPGDESVRDEALKFERYLNHPRHELGLGRYTDDTEMSVANALVLIENEPPYTPKMFADAWVREFARGGRRKGYSSRFQTFLEKVKTGEEFLAKIQPNSNKNGAAMRAVPFGVLRTVAEVFEVATMQAKITHDTPEGLFSARAVALMSHFAFYDEGSPNKILSYCVKHLPEEDRHFLCVFSEGWAGGPVCTTKSESVAITTVRAVVQILINHPNLSLRAILEEVIRWGGDTDSVAAIALGIAEIRNQSEIDLPGFMARDLEQGNPETGAGYLLDVGHRLIEKFKS